MELAQHFELPQASELVAKGQQKYDKGDRMGALKLWEQALKQVTSARQTGLLAERSMQAKNILVNDACRIRQ